MAIRWKLLIILLIIALLPLFTISLVDNRSAKKLGKKLANDVKKRLVTGARRELQQLIDSYAIVIQREKNLLELTLQIQAKEVERLLKNTSVSSAPIYYSYAFDNGSKFPPGTEVSSYHIKKNGKGQFVPMKVSYQHQSYWLPKHIKKEDVIKDIKRLAPMSEVYRFLHKKNSRLIHWQFTTLKSGVHIAYPGHGGYPASYKPTKRSWYTTAKKSNSVWQPMMVDVSTKKVMVPLAMPIYKDGVFAGVTAMDILMDDIFDMINLPATWADAPHILLVSTTSDLPLIVAQKTYSKKARWEKPIELENLNSSDKDLMEAVTKDMKAGLNGVRELSYKGKKSFWAYGAMGNGSYLVLIVPEERVIDAATSTKEYVLEETSKQLEYKGLISLLIVVCILILAWRAAKNVTTPIEKLAIGTREIGKGNFQAKVDINSSDELGELAKSFNVMVPRLKEGMRMKHSLDLAMEVQQNLLPESAPEIEGFDIAGKSLYCDETGGDYYDFIYDQDNFTVFLGDVSGHGIASALLMTTIRAMLQLRFAEPGTLAQKISQVNRHLSMDTLKGRFVTLFTASFDCHKQNMEWISAGHDPALLYQSKTDQFIEIEGKDIPLGIDNNWNFNSQTREGLREGEILVVGTDGIWEAFNDKKEMFGKEPLCEIIRANAAQSACEICDCVLRAVEEFRGSAAQKDDITLIVVKKT